MKIRELTIIDGLPHNVSNQELIYIRRAWHLARMSTERQRHGAILIRGRKTISVGCNTFRNDVLVCTNPGVEASYHAEHNALKQVWGTRGNVNLDNTAGSRLYVVRINRMDKLMPSAPCAKCETLLIAAGVREVVHS